MYTLYFEKQIEGFRESFKVLKYSRATITSYLAHVELFLQWLAERKIYDLKEVNAETMREYQVFVSNQNYMLHTIHLKLRSLKRFFEYLEKTHYVLINPAEKLIFPALGDRLPNDILTEAEMTRVLNAPNTGTMHGIRDKAMLELLYSTGIRNNECNNLKVYDVDYKGGVVRVNQGKGNKDRIIPLGRKACEWLREYILKVRPRLIKNNHEERTLFVGSGRALSSQAIRVIIKKHGKKAGIKRSVTAHTIRRTCATHLLRNDAHPLYIQRLLGHSTSSVLNKYIRVSGKDIKGTHKKTHPRK